MYACLQGRLQQQYLQVGLTGTYDDNRWWLLLYNYLFVCGFILFSDTFTCTENRSTRRRRLNTPYNRSSGCIIYRDDSAESAVHRTPTHNNVNIIELTVYYNLNCYTVYTRTYKHARIWVPFSERSGEGAVHNHIWKLYEILLTFI
jgi:hypothetical protein